MVAGGSRSASLHECFRVLLDDGTGKEFDQAVHDGLPEGRDLAVITKTGGTTGGKAAVVVTFTVQLPGGKIGRAQAVTTARAFVLAGKMIGARYGIA